MWREIKRIIQAKQSFILTTHVHPDGDGIGAACALIELLLKMGKTVKFVCDSPIPSKYAFLDFHGIHESFTCLENYEGFEVLIILDTHKKERIGRLAELIDKPQLSTICIDHHPADKIDYTPYAVIDPKACSVGAMIYTLLKEFGYELDLNAAKGLYTSVICDTGRFSYASTNRKAHKIADECIKLGVDPDDMYSKIFQHISLAEIKMFAKALQRMEIHLDNRVIIQEIHREDYEKLGNELVDIEHIDLEYFLEFNKLIEDVQCVVLLRELADGHVRVSIRTKANLDITPLTTSLGGGGHSNAAGLNWEGTVEEIKAEILKQLKALFANEKKSLENPLLNELNALEKTCAM